MSNGQHIRDAIGHTPLVALRRIVPDGSARIEAKQESANPTGSMKDRLAWMIVQRAVETAALADKRQALLRRLLDQMSDANDLGRREKAGVPEDSIFRTKP